MEPVVVVIPEAMKLKLIQDAEMIASKKVNQNLMGTCYEALCMHLS